ncbi:MAG: acyltransferase family protein [Acidobacteriota bacterium]
MSSTETIQQRYYELDWLRVIAIIILLFYHVGMIFVSWDWHIKNDQTSESLENVMIWFHLWRMPLLLFISGAGTRFALGCKTPRQYLKERGKRLLIPLIFGILVIVPPQIYFEKIELYHSFWAFYPTIFEFVPYPKGNFSWHHLWFILYLFVFSSISLPLFLTLRKSNASSFFNLCASIFTKKGGLLLPLIPIAICYLLLKPIFPEETHALINDWTFFVFYLFFFLFGYLLYGDQRLWQAIKEQRHFNIIVAIACTVSFYLSDWTVAEQQVYLMALLRTLKVAVSWTWVISIVGYGRQYLCFNHPLLKYSNEAIYPFYILHQTVIVVVGYYVIKWASNPWVKYAVVATLSFIISVGIYELLVKQFNVTRFLFGLKLIRAQIHQQPDTTLLVRENR